MKTPQVRSTPLHRLVPFGLVLALASPGAAAFGVYSYASAGASGDTVNGYVEDNDFDSNTQVNNQVHANAFVCPIGGCLANPGAILSDAYADARTDYGRNQARAISFESSVISSGAEAYSFWRDEVTFFGSGVGLTTTVVNMTFSLDGNWDDYGVFYYNAGLYDPQRSYFDADGGGTFYQTLARALATNQGSLQAPTGFFNLESYTGFPVIPGGDAANGTFDLQFMLTATVNVGQEYVLWSELLVAGGGGGDVNAYDTARLTGIVLAPGITMTSAAGALENYTVSAVPEPSTVWFLAAGIGLIAARLRFAASRS